jgi:hypothetical protein
MCGRYQSSKLRKDKGSGFRVQVQILAARVACWTPEHLNSEACPSSQLQLVQFAPIWFAFRFRLGRGTVRLADTVGIAVAMRVRRQIQE